MALSDIQSHLHAVYDIDLTYRVEDFLITDPDFLGHFTKGDTARATPEKLLFRESGGELLVSLYLAEELVEELRHDNPYERLHQRNLSQYCLALEGVSHFVYLTYNATHERPISQLELELQAEVDKYFLVWMLSTRQGRAIDGNDLSRWLFDSCRFDPELHPLERQRYETANRLARAFCNRIGLPPMEPGGEQPIYRELRRFYRKRHLDKLESAIGDCDLRGP